MKQGKKDKAAVRNPGKVTENDRTYIKKQLFIESYETSYGNITMACKMSEISRETFYRWSRTDAEFLDRIAAVKPKEKICDLAENVLVKNLLNNDTTMAIFTLKTLGKGRGYIERHEHTGMDGAPIQLQVNVHNERTKELIEQIDKL